MGPCRAHYLLSYVVGILVIDLARHTRPSIVSIGDFPWSQRCYIKIGRNSLPAAPPSTVS